MCSPHSNSVLTVENKTFPAPSGRTVNPLALGLAHFQATRGGNPSCETSAYATRCRGKHTCVHDEPREHERETLRLITQQEKQDGGETLGSNTLLRKKPCWAAPDGGNTEERPIRQNPKEPTSSRGEGAEAGELGARLALSLGRELRASVQSLGGPGGPRGRGALGL